MQGYVKNIYNNAIYVALNRDLTARVIFKNLSTKFIKNPAKKYPIGKLVTGRIISYILSLFLSLSLKTKNLFKYSVKNAHSDCFVLWFWLVHFINSVDGDKIDMSLKKTDVRLNRFSFDELKVGMTVKGWVKRIDPKHGVFISLKDCNIVGLCHLSEVLLTF